MNIIFTRCLRNISCWMIIVPFTTFTFAMHPVHSQQKDSCLTGVFITQNDFIHNRLSNKVDPTIMGYKINFSFPADITLSLKIVTPDSVYKFPPGSIYGYEECGRISRYYKGGKELNAQEDFYKIEEADKGLVIYSSVFISGNEIFYSLGLTSPIHRLTLRNLKNDFKDNSEFMAWIKKLHKRTDGLVTRDENGFLIMKLYRELIV